ncbi:TSUP family transporter [Cupriavidus basilensis]
MAVFSGALIQGATGMGFALVVVPVLALAAPAMLPGALLLAMLPLNAYVAWRERHAIDMRGAGWISAGRVAGTLAACGLLVAMPMAWLNIIVGGSTIAAALVSLLAPAFTPGRLTFASTGLITGVTETATGVGGPPLAAGLPAMRPWQRCVRRWRCASWWAKSSRWWCWPSATGSA